MSNELNVPSGQPILVIGGTGKTGRRVVQQLQTLGHEVRSTSRSGPHPFDWEKPENWSSVLQGVKRAYLTYSPDLGIPQAAPAIAAFAEEALKHGVDRLVLLSGRGEDGALRAEQALQTSGVRWTVVRASFFQQNFSESFLLDGIHSGKVLLPEGTAPDPFIDAEDIASVAVTALFSDHCTGEVLEVTGPRALTFAEATQEIALATGRPIEYHPIPIEVFVGALQQQGWPPEMVALMHELFTEVLDGRNTPTTDTVERVLRRPARDFSEYAKRTAQAGVWNPGPAVGV
ncbi:NAD(P)H-binding protein [Deinococcus cellulosilyticus]|uniref:NmrA family transcriptional regulator n=1 Tax=Deinococcus cellulosilyticus (strain DSM 18568 / NBRC 106333 / KACC 11606 / 5516J-15) TaxID=1223518 RepID=A0A511N1T9_DEIC1|nr:NAD(P)H-binding protein [Deinococcus cellulosilyticus]GEM46820.1 NmrA family transcriptional regulator [Deinococcus cellulosilyticus NBRC 106333 = KACC 11606]